MSLTIRKTWEFAKGSSRHSIVLEHNAFSGKQVVWVDDKEIHRVGYRYKLTGSIPFRIGSNVAEIVITATSTGSMNYKLMVNKKLVDSTIQDSLVTRWEFTKDDTTHQIAFDHASLHVFVNNSLVDSMGEFADVGSRYVFRMPNGEPADIHVIPGKKRDEYKLYISAVEILTEERQAEQAENVAAGGGGGGDAAAK